MKPTRLVGTFGASIIGSLFCFPNFASAAIIATHTGSNDPLSEGWSLLNSSSGVSVGPVNDGGTEAWSVDDNSTGNGTLNQYIQYLTTPQAIDADTNGWSLSGNLRVVDVNDSVDASVYLSYSDGSTRYQMYFGSDADGDAIVQLFDDVSVGASYTLEGLGSIFNSYELVYDPVAGSADLFVNGIERLSNYTGYAGVGDSNVAWGGGQSNSVGQGYYSSVQFEVSAVPIPPAAWLFGSGLLGLTGIARRKKSA